MTATAQQLVELGRMEEARRRTQIQLDLIERQIIRRMTAIIPTLRTKRIVFAHGKRPDPNAFMRRYRQHLAAITLERQPEIDALSRKLVRQDLAIEALRWRLGMRCDVAA